ncbi:putative oxidoreductase YdgJ [compost metagenome]
MRDKKYNIVIVGYGGMGSYHCHLIEPIKQLSVCGVYDIADYRRELAETNGYKTYHCFDAVLADETVDVILIATPNDVHKDIAINSLQAGKHVICEKPVTINSRDYLEKLEVAKRENLVFTVHQNRRWDEDFLIVKDYDRKKEIGGSFSCRISGSWS